MLVVGERAQIDLFDQIVEKHLIYLFDRITMLLDKA